MDSTTSTGSGGPRPAFKVTLRGANEPPFELTSDRIEDRLVLGRDANAALRLADERVSRRHCELRRQDDRWFMADLGSTAGTYVDGRKLQAGEQVRLRRGTLLSIGPYDLRFSGAAEKTGESVTDHSATSVGAVPKDELSPAARRLSVLMEFSKILQGASEVEQTLDLLTEAISNGSGFTRTLLLRDGPDGVNRLSGRVLDTDAEGAPISRSLLAAARALKAPVRLEERPELMEAMSIVSGGITAALCVPIIPATDDPKSDQLVAYLDAPGSSRRPEADAAGFVNTLVELARGALSAIERRSLEGEMSSMHSVQRKLMPAERDRLGAWRYEMACVPGRGAAGDVFAICGPEHSRSILLGDVSGKGPAAAMLMSLAVAHLDATLAHAVELSRAISLLGDRIVRDFNGQRFITAVAARLHPDGKATLIDAGHGIMLRVSAKGEVSELAVDGGVGIGMMGEADYDSTTLELSPGDRLVLFTDGITEQRDPAGQMLEIEGAARALAGSVTPEDDIRRLLSALRSHAAKPTFADDVTIASIVYEPENAA